jgi:hypothetical protein
MSMGYIGFPTITDPDVLTTAAETYMMQNISGWVPNDNNLEIWLITALAQMLATSRDVASIVPMEIFEAFGTTIANIPPISAAPSEVQATITVQDGAGYDIPAGTQFGFQATGSTLVIFQTLNDTLILPGYTTATNVIMLAEIAGSASNGLSGEMVIIDPLVFITDCTATTTSEGGVDAESITTYLNRLVADLQLLAPRPILPNDFAVLATSIAGVYRALGIDGYNASRNFTDGVVNTDNTLSSATANFTMADVGRGVSGTPIYAGSTIATLVSATQVTLSHVTTATGTGETITLAAMTGQERTVGVSAIDANGNVVNTTIQSAILAYLESLREANFVVTFVNPTVTTINVVFEIHCTTGANTTTVIAAVTAAIQAYITQATWGGGALTPPTWTEDAGTVRYLQVGALIEAVSGVDYLVSLTLNGSAADVAISGVAPLANYGTISGSAI